MSAEKIAVVKTTTKAGMFAQKVKGDIKNSSKFNRIAFAAGGIAFALGTVLFICSLACHLGPVATLLGFALALIGLAICALIAYKNHRDNNPTPTVSDKIKAIFKR